MNYFNIGMIFNLVAVLGYAFYYLRTKSIFFSDFEVESIITFSFGFLALFCYLKASNQTKQIEVLI